MGLDDRLELELAVALAQRLVVAQLLDIELAQRLGMGLDDRPLIIF